LIGRGNRDGHPSASTRGRWFETKDGNKPGACGHPSRRRFAAAQDDVR